MRTHFDDTMKTPSLRHLPLLISLCLPLAACKRDAAPPAATETQAATDSASSASAQPAAAPAPAAQKTAPSLAALVEPPVVPFDFSTVPEATGSIPPFPYLEYPPKVQQSGGWTYSTDMDRVYVILGDHLHAVEGRLETRRFYHKDADMSKLEVTRNYENVMRAMGAVKVNTVDFNNPAIVASAGVDEYRMRDSMLRVPDFNMGYDVYLARKGDKRHWIVIMTGDGQTNVMSIEEKPYAQIIGVEGSAGTPVTATGKPALAPEPLDIAALPVNSGALPPFPYLPYPPGLHEGLQYSDHANFDAIKIIVGKELRTIEGEITSRRFKNIDAKLSQMASRRNYQAVIKSLGAVKVNAVPPDDPAFLATHASNTDAAVKLDADLRMLDSDPVYDTYLLRTPGANVWMVLMTNNSDTKFIVIKEKAMEQSVALVTADTMRKELDTKGKIALYINFDTDKAAIRADGKPAVDEITKLLKADSNLKLAIEGHTDNSGDGARNLALSKQRAEAVVQTLVKDGIDAKRLRAAGHGADKPLADNKDEAGKAKNRRVELIKL